MKQRRNGYLLLVLTIKRSMSVIIKASRLGMEDKLFCIRGFYAEIGEDSIGIITDRGVIRKFFSLSAKEEYYIISAFSRNFTVDDNKIFNTNLCINRTMLIQTEGYSFVVFATSNESEMLSHSDISVLCSDTFNSSIKAQSALSFEISTLSRVFQLFPNNRYTIGSGVGDHIYVKLPGIEKNHCEIEFGASGLSIYACNGIIRVEREIYNDFVLLKNNSSFYLGSGLLPFHFKRLFINN